MIKKETNKNQSFSHASSKKYIFPLIFILLSIPIIFYILIKPKYDPMSDEVILKAAADQLNKNPDELTSDDFAKITELSFTGYGLTDIGMIKNFTNLRELDLWACLQEKTLPRWMNLLGKWGLIDLSTKRSIDLSPLRKLVGLRSLDLSYSPLKDIKHLEGLVNLEYLYLGNTGVSDISPLKNFRKLKSLNINNNPVSDITYLATMTNLSKLDISDTLVSDLSPIKNLIDLEELSIVGTHVSKLEPIKGLNNLTELDLFGTKVIDLTPLKDMTNLETLKLRRSVVSDLEPIKGLENLHELDIRNSQVSNIEPIKEMANLRRLYITYKTFTEMQDLTKALPDLEINPKTLRD